MGWHLTMWDTVNPETHKNTRNKTKRSKIYFTRNKVNNKYEIVPVLMFQQLLAKEIYLTHNERIISVMFYA